MRTDCELAILVVTDGFSYDPADGAELTRVLELVTIAAGVRPTLTLAHRYAHTPSQVTIGSERYTVLEHFRFDTAERPVTLAHYDQVWLFGIDASSFYLGDAEVAVIAAFHKSGGEVYVSASSGPEGATSPADYPRRSSARLRSTSAHG